MEHIVKIKTIEKITHDVLHIVTEKPPRYVFTPGQATDVSINTFELKNDLRPFTFTCLPTENYLEFTIKTYPLHNGVTNQLLSLKKNDELIVHDVFGDIGYKGPGVFIAGGAGVTPFISIFKYLDSTGEARENKLLFANKTKADIMREPEFKKLLGKNFINILSDEKVEGYEYGHITKELLQKYITGNDYIYLCGPPIMMDAVEAMLKDLKIESNKMVKEGF